MKRPVVGEVFSDWYPVCNKMGIPLEWVRRSIQVTEVRDYSLAPIDPLQFLERPLLRRGSTLIYGIDLFVDEPRKFYLEATPNYYLPTLRMGLFAPGDTLVDWIGKEYQPTRKGRSKMFDDVKKRLEWLARRPQLNLKLGIYRGEGT